MADSYSKFDQLSVILQGQTSYPMHGVTYVTEGQILSNYSSFTTTASSAAGMNKGRVFSAIPQSRNFYQFFSMTNWIINYQKYEKLNADKNW